MSRWRYWRPTELFLCICLLIADSGKSWGADGIKANQMYGGNTPKTGGQISEGLARLQESLRLTRSAPSRVKFNVWGGKRSPSDVLKPLAKAYRDEYRKIVCSYILNKEGLIRFNARCGGNMEPKRAQFRPWGGKRSPLQTTKFSQASMNDEYYNEFQSPSFPTLQLVQRETMNDQSRAAPSNFLAYGSDPDQNYGFDVEKDKKSFNAWGGKRGEGFNAWAGKRAQEPKTFGPNLVENKTYFNNPPQVYDNFDFSKINLRQIRSLMNIPDEKWPERDNQRPKAYLETLSGILQGVRRNHDLNRRGGEGFKPWAGKRSLVPQEKFKVGGIVQNNDNISRGKLGLGSISPHDAKTVENQKREFSAWGGKRAETTTVLHM